MNNDLLVSGDRAYTSYNVYRSTVSGSGYELIGSIDASSASFSDEAVVNDVPYYYVVSAVYTARCRCIDICIDIRCRCAVIASTSDVDAARKGMFG